MGQSSLQPAPAPVQPDHSVQFWSDSDSFLSGWATSISTAVEIGNAAVCVTTKIHTKALTRLFKQRGQDLTIAIEQGRYVPLDAAECISAVMPSGRFDQNRFVEFFGSAIAKALHAIEPAGSRVTVFGEAVDLLRSRGKFDDVILWERSWSALAKANLVSARCSYAVRAFSLQEENDHFQLICAEHSTVILPAGLPFSWSRGRRARLTRALCPPRCRRMRETHRPLDARQGSHDSDSWRGRLFWRRLHCRSVATHGVSNRADR